MFTRMSTGWFVAALLLTELSQGLAPAKPPELPIEKSVIFGPHILNGTEAVPATGLGEESDGQLPEATDVPSEENRTSRSILFGGGINSDAGLSGWITI